MPKVSVILPVHNGARFLREAVESILNQTYKDYEFIIINDASTDNSGDVIAEYPDRRIRLIHNKNNIGQSASLNEGISSASGEYIARMDQDDVSLPLRLQKQVRFMDEHPEVGVCGTFVDYIDDKSRKVYHSYLRESMVNSDELKAQLLFSSCFAHPTVMIRSAVLREHDIVYEREYEPAEDYRMWSRLCSVTDLANIPEFLLQLREHDRQQSILNLGRQSVAANDVREQILLEFLGGHRTQEELSRHTSIARFEQLKDMQAMSDAECWLNHLIEVNRIRGSFEGDALARVISLIWYYLFINSTHLGMATFRRFYLSALYNGSGETIRQHLSFFLKCLIKHKVRLLQTMP